MEDEVLAAESRAVKGSERVAPAAMLPQEHARPAALVAFFARLAIEALAYRGHVNPIARMCRHKPLGGRWAVRGSSQRSCYKAHSAAHTTRFVPQSVH
jgi:hypothetical protein